MGVLGAKPPRRTNHRQMSQAIGLHSVIDPSASTQPHSAFRKINRDIEAPSTNAANDQEK